MLQAFFFGGRDTVLVQYLCTWLAKSYDKIKVLRRQNLTSFSESRQPKVLRTLILASPTPSNIFNFWPQQATVELWEGLHWSQDPQISNFENVRRGLAIL